QMGDEEFGRAERNVQLPKTRRARAATVENESLRSGFHQNAGTEPVRARIGRSRSKQDNSEVGAPVWRRLRTLLRERGQAKYDQEAEYRKWPTHRAAPPMADFFMERAFESTRPVSTSAGFRRRACG